MSTQPTLRFKEITLLQKEKTLTILFSDDTQTQYTQVDISSVILIDEQTLQLTSNGQEKSYTAHELYPCHSPTSTVIRRLDRRIQNALD